MSFRPQVGDELCIDGITFQFTQHPAAPAMVYGQSGRQAIVYQLMSGSDQRALKVFTPRFRKPALVRTSEQIAPYANLPGLKVCQRTIFTPQLHRALLREHEELLYAAFMPWVNGLTWQEVVVGKQLLTPAQSLKVAGSLASVLAGIEQRELAHCDLSGPNIILPMLDNGSGVALVDVEGMYSPRLTQPRELVRGSPGYAHRMAKDGVWFPEADRFAGAVLLAEMLGWCDRRVRDAAWGESYFEPEEIHRESERYRLLAGVLLEIWGTRVTGLLERAWQANTLVDCGTFGEWLLTLPEEVPVLGLKSTSQKTKYYQVESTRAVQEEKTGTNFVDSQRAEGAEAELTSSLAESALEEGLVVAVRTEEKKQEGSSVLEPESPTGMEEGTDTAEFKTVNAKVVGNIGSKHLLYEETPSIRNPSKCAWCGKSEVLSFIDVKSTRYSGRGISRGISIRFPIPVCLSCKERIDRERSLSEEYHQMFKKLRLIVSGIIAAIIGTLLILFALALESIWAALIYAVVSLLFGLLLGLPISRVIGLFYRRNHPGHPQNTEFEESWGKLVSLRPTTIVFSNPEFARAFDALNSSIHSWFAKN